MLRSAAAAAVALLALTIGLARGQDSTEGTGFVLMFMQNIVEYVQPRPVELFFTNAQSQTAYVTVTLPGTRTMPAVGGLDACLPTYNLNVTAGSSVRLRLCSIIRHGYADGSVANKGVTVSSTSPIRVFGYNSDTFSADAFIVTRTQDLGRTHVVAAYSPVNIATQFGVVAPDDVNVFVAISVNRRDRVAVDYNGIRYTNGEYFRAQLLRHRTLLFYSVSDLSGVVVSADGPIAVFSGNVRAYVDATRASRDHLVEQVLPAAQLGSQYVFQPTPRSTSNDVVRFTARSPSTLVTLSSADNSTWSFSLANVGDLREVALTQVTHIVANGGLLSVAVIVRSQEGAEVASTDPNDPSLYYLADVTRYPPVNTISPSFVYSVTDSAFNRSLLLIATPTAYLRGFFIDGVAQNIAWSCLPKLPLPYCTAVVAIDPRSAHVITHSSAAARALMVLYSASDRESAATILGLSLNGACKETTMSVSDKIDNDCDGYTDEELLDGVDNDHDLLIDEDCYAGFANSAGSEYAVVFMSNDVSDLANVITELELYATSVTPNVTVTVTVTSPHSNFQVNKTASFNAATQIRIPSDFLLGKESDLGHSRATNKGLRVKASGGDIVLYGINKRTYSTDGFICLPYTSAGKVYYAVTSYPINTGDDRCQIAIVSHDDGASDITVTLRSKVTININGLNYVGPTQFTLPTMNRLDAWELHSSDDLTGTKVESPSGRKFSVYSGNVRHRITLDRGSRDHIVEQMPPKSTLGTVFSSISSPRVVPVGDIWKIVASEPNTTVNYWYSVVDTSTVVSGTITLNQETDFDVINPNKSVVIRILANKPVLVTQIVKSTTDYTIEMTDPALILIPPQEQWGSNYLFVTPKSGQSNGTAQLPYYNYIFLVVDQSARAGLALVNPDGSTTLLGSVSSWKSVPQTTHQALVYPVQDGQNTIKHISNASATYMGIMFGVQDRESYGQAVGLRLANACVKNVQAMIPGDLIDNDCDGKVDEELVDMLDNDGDGLIDEDGYALPPLTVTYVIAYEQNDVEYPRYYPLELYIGNDNAADLYCNVKSNAPVEPRYDVTAKLSTTDVETFAFSPALRLFGTRKSSATFTVRCSAKATVFGINKETWSNDGFVALPATALGRSYYTVSYGPQELESQFAVVAAEGGVTSVAIKLASSVAYSSVLYGAGDTLTASLNAYEAIQIQSPGDLTGSYVTADKRVAVFSGNVRTHVVLSQSRDHLVSQLQPTDSWGTDFNLVPNPGRTVGDVYRVMSAADANSFALCCNGTTGVAAPSTFVLQAGHWQELQLSSNSFCRLTATKPAQVARIMKSQNGPLSTELGDPCMTTVPPVAQYGSSATLTPPMYTGGKAGVNADYTNYLTLVVPRGAQSGLLINGNPPDNVNQQGQAVHWVDIQCSSYTTGTVVLDSSVRRFRVTHQSTSVLFSGFLAGGADRESYCVTIAQNVPDLA